MGNDFFQSRTLKPCKTCISINTNKRHTHNRKLFTQMWKQREKKQAKQNIKSTTNKTLQLLDNNYQTISQCSEERYKRKQTKEDRNDTPDRDNTQHTHSTTIYQN
uniref:(northern house mosquito) hypothetical protein n=1 Tax=Culex pipiens TaxID=7175 RepID=A0A8D8L2F2_CULPI